MTEGWNDQRVNQLKKLWQQGKSASEIAETLGGVTRNAVIGKAHRLGLSGRPSPIKKPAAAAKKPVGKVVPAKGAAAAKPAAKAPAKAAPKAAPAKPLAKPTALKAVPAPKVAPAKKPIANQSVPAPKSSGQQTSKGTPFNPPLTPEAMARPLMVHDGKVISILELTERNCRWPIGDPKDPAFGYCGLNSHPGFPYCAGHVAMAFQSSRKDQRKVVVDVKADEDLPELEVEDIEDVEAEEGLEDDALDDEADDELSLEV
ncbi:MAG TPA: GcrA family cell cycle regulator [Alphaproteobacteria bacterium]